MEKEISEKTPTIKTDLSILTAPQLNEMLSAGIVGYVKKGARGKFSFGFRGGAYLGSPGKDIFVSLFHLSDIERSELANKLANQFPVKPPNNHVKWAACIRYIYGCFEKQGCLRSKSDFERMKQEDSDWTMPMAFMEQVADCFKKKNNIYGLTLHYEMKAHRFGDRAMIQGKPELLSDAISFYEQSYKFAKQCKSLKHMFTPFFWAGFYAFEMQLCELAIEYHLKCLEKMEKYCPDTRDGYREKASTSLSQLRACMHGDAYSKLILKMSRYHNKIFKKIKIPKYN